MKIVFTSIFRSGSGGGAGRVAHELAGQFAIDHDVVMVCPGETTVLTRDEKGLAVYSIRSAGDSEFQMPDLSSRAVRKLFKFLDEFQPDIVHAHEPALMGLIGQIWAKMNQVPFVHTTHVLPAKAKEFGATDTLHVPALILKSSITNYAIQGLLSNFFQNCDALIALNQPALESIQEFGYEGPVFVIPNGRALAHYDHRDYADISQKEKKLVFIGFLSDRKNQFYLLKALNKLPGSYSLKLIGRPLNPEYRDKLEKYIQKNDLKNVEFVGQINHEEIPAYLEEAHVFTSASIMEVQSLVIIEALASGTPVVGLSNETIDELIDENVGAWLAKDQKPSAFAAQVDRVCNLAPDEYRRICQNARDRVSHLDWSNVVDKTVEAYGEIRRIRPIISEDDSELLSSLVKFFAVDDLRDYLLEVIEEYSPLDGKLLPRVKMPEKMQTWTRVRPSTWIISGVTVVVSVLGYIFMRGRGKQEEN